MLDSGHWRMIQTCRVYWNAQFLNTDHRLVVASLKLQLKSGRMVPSQPRLGVGKLNNERVGEELAKWGVYWDPQFSALVWTGFWGECRRDQAVVHHLGMSRSLTFIFTDDAVIFVKTLDILLEALEVLNEESELLGLRVSSVKTEIQAFIDILDAAVCLYLFVVRMLRSRRDSLPLAVIFMSLLAVSQKSTVVWVGPGESWIDWIMRCGAVGTCAGGRKSESSGPYCFQSCAMGVRLLLCPGI